MLGELDSVDAKQQGAASSADPVTPIKGNDNDQQSSDQEQASWDTATASNHERRASNQRTTARKRTAK